MNITSSIDENVFNDIQYGNKGAALFIITYIGFYGLSIICLFGQQLKATQRERQELPVYFLKTFWDVPSKNRLYQELADVERLKQIFRGYFADHETYTTVRSDHLQAIVEERAYACALKYQEKLRNLHLAHTDYYTDMVEPPTRPHAPTKSPTLSRTNVGNTINDSAVREDDEHMIVSVSVV